MGLGSTAAFSPASLAVPGGLRIGAAAAPRIRPACPSSAHGAALAGARGRRAGVRMASSGGEVDTKRIATYFGATGAEVLLITAAMGLVQTVGAQLPEIGSESSCSCASSAPAYKLHRTYSIYSIYMRLRAP